MPLTPQFELTQDDTQVYLTIWVPTVRLDAMEVVLECREDDENEDDDNTSSRSFKRRPNVVHFYAAPYLLKLNFTPYSFLDDSEVTAQYDPSFQKVTVPLLKSNPGISWENLELTARLLAPTQISKQWLHAVVAHDDEVLNGNNHDDHDSAVTTASNDNNPACGYGYGGIFQNIFTDYCRGGLAAEMLHLVDPETTSASERRPLRHEREEKDFDAERYMGDLDLTEDYMYPMVLEFRPFWSDDNNSKDTTSLVNQMKQLSMKEEAQSSSSTNRTFTSEERLQLATIPYPLLPPQHLTNNIDDDKDYNAPPYFWPQLLDLLIPYVYDQLTTLGDSTVESAWTISTLSCSLSWLDVPTSIEDVILQTSRRMLIYPYWRNLEFVVEHVLRQTLLLLQKGSHSIIKALLQIRTILEQSESYYVGNKIFVDPILSVIQQRSSTSTPSQVLQEFREAIQGGASQLKVRLGLDLENIERMYLKGEEVSTSSSEDDTDSSEDESSSVEDDDEDEDNIAEVLDADTSSNNPPLLLDSLVGSARSTASSSILLLDEHTNTRNSEISSDQKVRNAESAAQPKPLIQIVDTKSKGV